MYLNQVDRENSQKLYCQILERLKEHIEKAEWSVGAKIPSEEQLSSQYNVSRATVRLAIEELVALGYLKKFQGKGTFVRRKKRSNSIVMLTSLDDEGICKDITYTARILETKNLKPDSAVADYLGFSEEDQSFYLSRLISDDDTPVLLQKLYISYSFLPRFIGRKEAPDVSLCAFLENTFGIKIHRMREITDVSCINEEDAPSLDLKSGSPVLRTRHGYYAHGDQPFSYSESLYRTDAFTKTAEFERLRI